MKLDMSPSDLPFVSVVMPVRNEGAFIGRSLAAVLSQDYPHDRLEVIIADGHSTDDTRTSIEGLKSVTDVRIEVLDNPEKVAPTGLNRAIARSRGEIVIRVDGHCEVEKDYVRNCVKHLSENKAECVGGPIKTIGQTIVAQAIATAMSSRFGVGNSAFRTLDDREMLVDTVAFPGYRRKVLEQLGGFNEELVRNQDDEFNYRLRGRGGRILLAPDVRSRYYSRSNLQSLWHQYFQYGYWKVRVLQLHPRQMSVRQFAPFVFVAVLLMMVGVSIAGAILFSLHFLWLPLVQMSTYFAANIAATCGCSRRTNIKALPYVSLSFAILHFSYGIGFAWGLLRFRKGWRIALSADNPAAAS